MLIRHRSARRRRRLKGRVAHTTALLAMPVATAGVSTGGQFGVGGGVTIADLSLGSGSVGSRGPWWHDGCAG
jgi:hypothetical protein